MRVVNQKSSPTMDNPHKVKVCKLYDTEHAQAIHITVEPGESLKRHVTPVDVFFYVLEGKGVVEVGDEQMDVEKDDLVDSPARIPHCWYNRGTEILRVLVVKVPRPKEATRLL